MGLATDIVRFCRENGEEVSISQATKWVNHPDRCSKASRIIVRVIERGSAAFEGRLVWRKGDRSESDSVRYDLGRDAEVRERELIRLRAEVKVLREALAGRRELEAEEAREVVVGVKVSDGPGLPNCWEWDKRIGRGVVVADEEVWNVSVSRDADGVEVELGGDRWELFEGGRIRRV